MGPLLFSSAATTLSRPSPLPHRQRCYRIYALASADATPALLSSAVRKYPMPRQGNPWTLFPHPVSCCCTREVGVAARVGMIYILTMSL